MKEYTLSKTARCVMNDRAISQGLLEEALWKPDRILISKKQPELTLTKKIYFNEFFGSKRLLLVFSRKQKEELVVLTLIETSHIDKYF